MSVLRAGTAGLTRMVGRDPGEGERSASSLELFFDLAFVVAVSVAADELLGFDVRGHPIEGLVAYCFAFFGIWWAWVGFTWLASAFDTDDWAYRLLTVVQIGGVLVYAASIPALMEHFEIGPSVVGYVLIRMAQVAQYGRAARSSPYRSTEIRYAVGVTVAQCLWVADVFTPSALHVPAFLVLVVVELSVPLFAEAHRATPFHRGHIADRYGAFTLIVLGEGLLTVTNAVIAALRESEHLVLLAVIGAEALVLLAGMWWIYFAREQQGRLTSIGPVFAFGYAHYAVFAAAGALAAGVETAIDRMEHDAGALPAGVQALTTVPVAVFLLVVWTLALRPAVARATTVLVLALTAVEALSALVRGGLAVAALAVVLIVVALEVDARRDQRTEPPVTTAPAG